MVNLREIDFDEEVFKKVYDDYMVKERPLLPVEQIGGFSKYELMAIDNIELDFDSNDKSCLDIGCANGSFVLGLSKLGLINNGAGIDISSKMIEYAQETNKNANMGINFINSSIESFNVDYQFDIVTVFDTLEHLVNPMEMLKKIRNFIKPGGFIYGSIPDGHTCDAEVHLHHYDMNGLHKLLLNSFKRITIIPLNLYEDVPNHFPEIRLFFRCQRGKDA